MNPIKPNSYTFLLGYYDKQGEFWCTSEYSESEEDKAREAYKTYLKVYPERHVELIQQNKTFKSVEHYYPKKSIPIKERYWLIEYEDRDPDFSGWSRDEDVKYLSVSQAIKDAESLAENEGEFFRKLRVVEIYTETIIDVNEVAVFETK